MRQRYTYMIFKLLSFWLMALVLISCSKEDSRINKIVEDDRIINFGATSDSPSPGLIVKSKDEIGTKTQYGIIVSEPGEDPYIQIEWKLTDIIRVSSPNSPGLTVADYQVSQLEPTINNTSVNVRPFDYSSYLIWGDESQQHSFYGVYPSPQTQTMSSNVSISNNITTTTLPSNQTSSSPEDMMKYAYMAGVGVNANMENPSLFGQNKIYPSDARKTGKNLIYFAPITTTFRIDFKNQIAAGTTITKVSLISQSKAMCGTYQTTLSDLNMTTRKVGMTHNTSAWTPSSTNKTIYASTDSDQSQYAPSETQSVTLFALPQNYNDLSVVFEASNGRTYTLALKKSGSYVNFDAYKYHVIQIGDVANPIVYHIDVDPPTISFNYLGGSDQYAVESYKHDLATDVKTPLEWKTQINTGTVESPVWIDLTNSNMPDWISGVEKNVVPTTSSPISYTAVVPDQDVSFTPNSHTLALKARAEVGSSSSPVDLSRVSLPTGTNGTRTAIQQTTANCYVVGAKGWYKFPMVYGNAIHNGNTNTSAYISAVTSDLALSNFVDHKGSPISQPWVSTAYSISKVALIWEDQPKLITELSMSGTTEKYITFRVTEEAIHQGNALIAAYDSENKVAWSWHIWVTNEDLTTVNMKNSSGTTFKTLPVNIGTVRHTEQYTYEGRVAYFRVVQYESGVATGQVKEFTISQIETICPEEWNTNTLYQFGRKDPMLGSDGRTHFPKRIWYSDNTFERTLNPNYLGYSNSNPPTVAVQAIDMLSKLIQNPFTYCMSRYMDNMYYNLWNMNQIVTSANNPPTVVKTVYDPSPAGLSLPHASAYSSFPNNYQLRTNPYDYSYGINFYMEPNKRGQLLFFPTFGARNYSSNFFMYPELGDCQGYWWTSGIYGSTHASGYSLGININGRATLQGTDRAYGLSVRPVEESNGINPYTSTNPWNDTDPPIGLDW